MFATSKRKRATPFQTTKTLDKGKEKMENVEQKVQVRRSKRIKKTSQGPLFVDLDNDNEDQGMSANFLLLEKDAQLLEWENDFERAQRVIYYYKEEHKHFKEVKRGLALQKKMVKHYARKSMLANAKLKQALMELEEIKRTKVHEILGILADYSQ